MTLEVSHLVLLIAIAGAGLGLGWLLGLRRMQASGDAQLQQLRFQSDAQRQALEAQWQAERAAFVTREAMLQARSEEQQRNSERLQQERMTYETRGQIALDRLKEVEIELAELRVHAGEAQRASDERMRLLNDAREQLRTEFKQLSQQIFDEKTEKLDQHSKKLVEGTLLPLREQLGDFKKRIEDVYDKEAKDRTSLAAQVQQLYGLNQTLGQQALSLSQALRGQSKVRGNWGEQTLETLLAASGLVKGIDYDTQKSLKRDDGGRSVPDAIVHLPDQREVIIDSKVSLTAYLAYCESELEETRQSAARAHVASLRGHVNDLAEKDYASLIKKQAIDFVLLFVPIEPALLLALQSEAELFTDAYRRKIIIVGPSTLLATLRTIEGIWRLERQSKNAEEIARRAGELWDQLALSLESLAMLGKSLDGAQRSYEETISRLSTGRANLKRRAEALRQLGVKGKKELPAAFMARLEAAESEDEDQAPDIADHALPALPIAAGE
jgi:DNA recombination protein RmuC